MTRCLSLFCLRNNELSGGAEPDCTLTLANNVPKAWFADVIGFTGVPLDTKKAFPWLPAPAFNPKEIDLKVVGDCA